MSSFEFHPRVPARPPTSKCCKLESVPQLFSSFVVFALGPTFGSFEKFGGTSKSLRLIFFLLVVSLRWP